MPRHINPPKTIDERGGLLGYLDETADIHNGLVYKDFVTALKKNDKRKHKLSAVQLAEDFNVSSRTWYSWLARHKREQATSQAPMESSD